MKYVRGKDGTIEILADGDSIPAGAETIFSTDPSVYEGTWENETSNWERGEEVPSIIKQHADISTEGRKQQVQEKTVIGDIPRNTSYIGTKGERQKTKYDPEKKLLTSMKKTGWTEPHKAHPEDKICLECGKLMPGARPNKKFCSDKCRDAHKKRASRAKASAIKQFRPHMGKEGQIYYMINGKISFVPALWSDTEKRATKYVTERYEGKELEDIVKQIKGVMKNE